MISLRVTMVTLFYLPPRYLVDVINNDDVQMLIEVKEN